MSIKINILMGRLKAMLTHQISWYLVNLVHQSTLLFAFGLLLLHNALSFMHVINWPQVTTCISFQDSMVQQICHLSVHSSGIVKILLHLMKLLLHRIKQIQLLSHLVLFLFLSQLVSFDLLLASSPFGIHLHDHTTVTFLGTHCSTCCKDLVNLWVHLNVQILIFNDLGVAELSYTIDPILEWFPYHCENNIRNILTMQFFNFPVL